MHTENYWIDIKWVNLLTATLTFLLVTTKCCDCGTKIKKGYVRELARVNLLFWCLLSRSFAQCQTNFKIRSCEGMR